MEAAASHIGNTLFQRLIGLDPPEHIYMLDGIIEVPPFKAIAIGATPGKRDFVLFTPLSDERTFFHESIHASLGVGEIGARAMARVVEMRARLLPKSREVRYSLCTGCREENILLRIGLRPKDPAHTPNIVHYVLERPRSEGQSRSSPV